MTENEGDNVSQSEHVFSGPDTLAHQEDINNSTDLDVGMNETVNSNEGETLIEPEEEVFGVVDPDSILNAVPIVGRRGRKGIKESGESESDEAYSAAESEDAESDSNSEFDSEDEYSDDEGDDGEYDDDEDGEEYGRNRKHRPNYYQQSQRSQQSQMPPVLAAITEKMFQQKQQINSDNALAGRSSSGSNLTAAQFQEMARNAVSSLASSSRGPSDRALPVLLPRTPQATESIRENVSQELKQSIASMLMNPELRAALIAKLQANKASSTAPIQPKPKYSNKFTNYEGPGETVTSSRARRATKSVDYANFFKDDAFEESSPESTPRDSPQGQKKLHHNSIPSTPSAKRRGRPPKSESHETRSKTVVDVKSKNRHMYDEDSDEEYDEFADGDNASIGSADSGPEPGIEKILSHRKVNGKDEFFVKFHNLAYIHADWVGREEIVTESGGASRVSRFLSKPLTNYHFDDKNIYNPEFNLIDRIVYGWNHPDPENSNKTVTSYLIKWCALPLDQTTWEKESTVKDLADGPDAIKHYESIPDPWKKRENALAVGRRPDASQWSRLEASPQYKSDNSLRQYQLEGLNWLVYCWMHKQSCIIADEMGLGKTVQTVSFLDMIYNRFNVRGPFLVVAPLSTLPHWQREFAAWTDLRVLLYHGTEAARDVMFEYEFFYKDPRTDQIIPGLCKFDVILTTYEMTLSGQHHLRNIIWRVGVFDEAHRLKNKVSKAAEVLQTFQIEHKVLLTGTPIQNSLDELFALLNFLQPHRFYSSEVFLKEYGNLRRSEDVERLQALLKPLMLRRLKEDVEKSIPVKEETIIEVELTSIQKRYYRAILERNFGFLMKGAKANNMPNLINTMMELRKCCIHPYLIKGAEDRILSESAVFNDFDAQMNCMVQSSGKLVLVDKLLKKLREGGHKVLIFSQMTRCLDILSDFIRWRGYPVERIDGAIRGDERQASIDRYCDPNRDSFVFLLCTKAGGVGINLTAADTVVIFDSDWNPQNDLQAQARCHRIGQTKSVKIYRLITRNTYEREMFDRAGMKLGLDKAILQKMGPESSGLDDLTESSATPQLSKTQVEDLLKKGAYGILMENDDAGMKFMDEDIDSILERRTTVIKHDNGAKSESRSAMDGSIFSKASFAATADDLDLDLDDPNFWELWAKKMNVDPSHIQSSGVAVDDSRIRRVIRRLLSHSKDDYGKVLSEFPCALSSTKAEEITSETSATLWTEEERSGLVRLLLRFGLCSFDRIRSYFPQRSQNDLIAATKIILKTCIERVAEDEPKFKEDSEKLLLSKIEFERLDKKTARQAAAEGEEEGSGVPLSAGEFAKSDIPYSGASRKHIMEYRSFFKDENCPESFRESVYSRSYEILMILQVVELLRKILEEVGGSSINETEAFESLAGLSIPNSAGSGPASWWDRDEDLALLIGTIRYGFGEFEAIKKDSSLAWMHQLQKEGVEFPDSEKVFERIFKLVMAIEKRNRASAKLAMHSMNLAGGRRRAGFEEEEPILITRGRGSGRSRRGADDDEEGVDDDDEEYVAPMEEKRGRGRPKRRQTFSTPSARFIATWSKPQRAEFNRFIYSFGVPLAISEDSYDWTVFRELMRVKNGPEEEFDEKDVFDGEEEASQSDNSIIGKSDEELNKYMTIYLNSCKYSAERPSRRRGRPSKTGKIVDEDGDEDDLGEIEDEEDEEAVTPDSIIEMAPERAKKSLSRVELFSKMRSEEICNHPHLSEILQDARRSSGLPRWWIIGEHDEALLKGAIEFGFGRPDLLIKNVQKFREIYDQIESGDLNVRESRRKTAVISDALSTNDSSNSSNYPVVDGIDANKLSWPNELIILRRLELIVELLEANPDHIPTVKSPAKAKKEKTRKSDLEEPAKKKVTVPKATIKKPAAPKAAKKPPVVTKNPASPARRRANNTVTAEQVVDDFPPIQSGRTKRQKTLTDFGFSKK